MSNIYNLEPHAHGLIVLKTTFGDLELELFTKQCPKNTRNFVQHCLDGYYEGTTFERVEKDFIAIGGELDLPETDLIETDTVPDEFHSRLKFSRRGLLATANTDKDINGPKFFFTLGPAPELQNKHTIFGRVKGDSVYNLVDLNDCNVNEDMRPISEKKIIQVIVVDNPHPELTIRSHFKKILDDLKRAKDGIKEDEDDVYDDANNTEYLEPKFDLKQSKKLSFYQNSDDDDDDDDDDDEVVNSSEKKGEAFKVPLAASSKDEPSLAQGGQEAPSNSDRSVGDDSSAESKPSEDAREKKLREIREQIKKLKQKLENESATKIRTLSDRRRESLEQASPLNVTLDSKANSSKQSSIVEPDLTSSSQELRLATKKGHQRERETIELMQNFKKKLKKKIPSSEQDRTKETPDLKSELYADEDEETELALDLVDDDNWLHHKFDANNTFCSPLAKDANTKGDDWYSIDDPRNPIVKRVELEKAREYKRNKERDRHRADYDSHERRHRSEHHKSSRHHHR